MQLINRSDWSVWTTCCLGRCDQGGFNRLGVTYSPPHLLKVLDETLVVSQLQPLVASCHTVVARQCLQGSYYYDEL